jgi:hypothetical protein
METRAAMSLRARAEPSWPRVLGTTLQLWLRRRRRIRWALLAAALALAAGSGVLLAQPGHGGAGQRSRAARPLTPAAAAASWVAAQVSRGALVSCDPAMCAALRQRGFPAADQVVLGTRGPGPAGSSLVVVTPAVRRELGGLVAASAPVVVASFGSASVRVEIRVVAPHGAAGYLSQLRADVAARAAVGGELLHNPAVQADPLARQQLSAGDVDPRLIATVGILAALYPVHLVSFGDLPPGASPGVPLRSAVLYGVTHGVTAGNASVGSLRALLLAQRPPYRPAGIGTVRLAAGRSALRLWFGAPAPLGLLDASQPLVTLSPP